MGGEIERARAKSAATHPNKGGDSAPASGATTRAERPRTDRTEQLQIVAATKSERRSDVCATSSISAARVIAGKGHAT